jgi:hypothetical protein
MEFLPGRPQGSDCRGKKDYREDHADHRAPSRVPSERDEDQPVDGRIFQKVDRVSKQRYRSDCQRNRKLNAEIAKVQQRYERHGGAKRGVCSLKVFHRKVMRLVPASVESEPDV